MPKMVLASVSWSRAQYIEILRSSGIPAMLVLPRLPAELLLERLQLFSLCPQQLLLALGQFLCQLELIPGVLGTRWERKS